MTKPEKRSYRRTLAANESSMKWRRAVAEVRRERVFTRLGGKCRVCGSTDRYEVKIRKLVDEPLVDVGRLWNISKEGFEDIFNSPRFLMEYQLLCTSCRSQEILDQHKHGSPQKARVCKCDECTSFRNDRSVLFRKQAQLRKLRTTLRDVEREVAEREAALEARKRHAMA